MLVLGIVGYLLIGLLLLYMTVLIHMVKAENAGYRCFDYWDELTSIMMEDVTCTSFILGLIIWPIRLAEFVSYIPELYKQYELREF